MHASALPEEGSLERAQRLDTLGALACGVIHDTNNHLALALCHLELLEARLAGQPEARRPLAQTREALDHAIQLLKAFLAYGRCTPPQRTRLDLNDLLRETAAMLEGSLDPHHCLVLDLDPALPVLYGDRLRFEQVLVNLALNARDAMPGGGTLTLRSRRGEGCVELQVADTGTGLSEAARAHLFEPFFTTKGVGHGTGLGLAMAAHIVRGAGGEITADSAAGQGTRFTLRLPLDLREQERL